jgi:molybdopterin/thiamine biosynthesis adenylyltransferase/rhodanese-related sulfurtransferase
MRYSRQINLQEIGEAGQQKLAQASILCIGAGGLGSPALLYLAAAGVGRIGVIDFDCVDESNLQRQILFSTAEIGAPKANEAKRKLTALNPTIQIDAYDEELNIESASRLFPLYDIILDGTDNFETKFLINDAAIKYRKPLIYGAIQGFEGQASVFGYQNGPCYRCLYPQKPKAKIMNCAEAGVIGAVAGIVGVTQAIQAIHIIVEDKSFSPLVGRMWLIDTKTMETRILSVPKDPNCPCCGQESAKKNIVLQYSSPVCAFIPEISVAHLQAKRGYTLIDVREQDEWDRGHIDGAVLWPLSCIMAGNIPDEMKDDEIILYCQKGVRSLQAGTLLKEYGFTDITSLSGGYAAWEQS